LSPNQQLWLKQLSVPKFTDSNPGLLDRKAAQAKQGPLLRRPANNGNLFRFYQPGGDAEALAFSYGVTPSGINSEGRYEDPELGEALTS
jgi:hypothetical protein